MLKLRKLVVTKVVIPLVLSACQFLVVERPGNVVLGRLGLLLTRQALGLAVPD
jgi:hypothetical protein